MTVWFPRRQELAQFDPTALPEESPFAEVAASHTFQQDAVSAIGDRHEPRWSNGKKVTRWSSRPQKERPQWVEGRFSKTKRVRSIGLYWFDNQDDVRIPAEWSVEIERDGKWQPFELYVTDEYGVRVNQYNVIHPAAELRCDAIRIHMTPRDDACVGILEIDVALERDQVALQE